MKAIKLFSMAALALMMGACAEQENEIIQKPETARQTIPFKATIGSISGNTTRTIYTLDTDNDGKDIITVAWRARDEGVYDGDEIALIHGGVKDVVTVTYVDPVTGEATIEGQIMMPSGGLDEEDVAVVYPAASVGIPTGGTDYESKIDYTTQDGTLEYIQNNLDIRVGSGKIIPIGPGGSLKSKVSMQSKIAIWKLSLQDNAATPAALSATAVTVKVGSTTVAAAASAAKSDYYICLAPATMGTGGLTIEATVGSDTYAYTKTGGVTLTAGNYYQSTVTMAPAYTMAAAAMDADKGKLICTDGHIHAYGENVACTADRVAKIIYVGSSTGDATYNHGLALALADEGSKVWDAANTACSTTKNTNTPVTDASWMLPSQSQWETMIGTDGAGDRVALRDGFTSVGGLNMSGYYWSSTKSGSNSAQVYDFQDGLWDNYEKDNPNMARAGLAF